MTTEQIIHNKQLMEQIKDIRKCKAMAEEFARYWDIWSQEFAELLAVKLAELDPPYIVDDLQMVVPL